MTGEHDGAAVWWPSPYGPGRCLLCPAPAALVVRDLTGEEADLCAEHGEEALRRSGGLIRGVRFTSDPAPED
jgi:hypothetical protein